MITWNDADGGCRPAVSGRSGRPRRERGEVIAGKSASRVDAVQQQGRPAVVLRHPRAIRLRDLIVEPRECPALRPGDDLGRLPECIQCRAAVRRYPPEALGASAHLLVLPCTVPAGDDTAQGDAGRQRSPRSRLSGAGAAPDVSAVIMTSWPSWRRSASCTRFRRGPVFSSIRRPRPGGTRWR